MRDEEFYDSNNVRRRVSVPDDFEGDLSEGIPVSLDLSKVFPDAPWEFIRRLTDDCFALNLVTPDDFLRPGAVRKIQAALHSALEHDALSIQRFAKENRRNG